MFLYTNKEVLFITKGFEKIFRIQHLNCAKSIFEN